MPERDWRQQPAKYNAAVSKYCKDGVSVSYVQPKGDHGFIVARAAWGPWMVMDTSPGEAPDLEQARRNYLCHHPSPRLPTGLSCYEWLRRPAL